MKLSAMIKQLKRLVKGSLRSAIEDGLRTGKVHLFEDILSEYR